MAKLHTMLVVYGYQRHDGAIGNGNVHITSQHRRLSYDEIRETEKTIREQNNWATVVLKNIILLRD